MKNTAKELEFPIMLIHVHRYMSRIHRAMKGMKYMEAEKCRINYWNRFLIKVREGGFFPMWTDFKKYLELLPTFSPKITESEYETIMVSTIVAEPELQLLNEESLQNALVEIAFKDYLQKSFQGARYLTKARRDYKVASFWDRIALVYITSNLPFKFGDYTRFVERFQIPEPLKVDKETVEKSYKKMLGFYKIIK